jgi:hypothetical protein
MDVSGNPVVASVRKRVVRGFHKPEASAFRAAFLRGLERSSLFSADGRPYWTCAAREDRLGRVVAQTTAGLFFHLFDHRVPDGYAVGVRLASQLDFVRLQDLDTIHRTLLAADPVVSFPGIYACRIMRDTEDLDFTIWWHEFYGAMPFMATTLRPSGGDTMAGWIRTNHRYLGAIGVGLAALLLVTYLGDVATKGSFKAAYYLELAGALIAVIGKLALDLLRPKQPRRDAAYVEHARAVTEILQLAREFRSAKVELLRHRLAARSDPDLEPLIDARNPLLSRTWELRSVWLHESGEAAVRRFLQRVERASAPDADALDAAEREIEDAFQELEQSLTRALDQG